MQAHWNKIIAETNAVGAAYLIAVSGGVDSVFLLELMAAKCERPMRVVHFNHRLRANASEEEALVRETSARLGLELHVGHGNPDVMRSARSLEAEARRQRYGFFDTVIAEDELLVTAHHANDQLETIMLRLMRGYPHGNLRMLKRDGNRYRPLLDVPKAEIVRQATNRGYRWMEDESNADPVHERNWVRNVLIPEMETRRNVLQSMVFTSRDAEDGWTTADGAANDISDDEIRPSRPSRGMGR